MILTKAVSALEKPFADQSIADFEERNSLSALRGEMSMDEAIALIQQQSRRYAKRQRTWFRRNEAIHWILRDEMDDEAILQAALAALE